MRRLSTLSLLSLAAFAAVLPSAEAQTRRTVRMIQPGEPGLVLRVRPRSFLDAGNVVQPGTTNRYATQDIVSYIVLPPYQNMRDRFGEGTLPDPIGGPFVGGSNPFGPGRLVAPVRQSRRRPTKALSSSRTTASPISPVPTAFAPAPAMSFVRRPEASTSAIGPLEQIGRLREARTNSAAPSPNEPIMAIGFARPRPAMSGAEPCTGS